MLSTSGLSPQVFPFPMTEKDRNEAKNLGDAFDSAFAIALLLVCSKAATIRNSADVAQG